MWWRIGNFVLLCVMVYMVLTLGVSIGEDIDVTTGVCFAGVAVTICVLGHQWLETFRRRREAAKERLRRWQEISEKLKTAGDKIILHHQKPDISIAFDNHFKPDMPNYYIVPRDGDIRGN